MSSPETITARNVDLSNCDRELVQYPSAILPHGAMLILTEPDLEIIQVSANIDQHLGMAAQDLIGKPLNTLCDSEIMAEIRLGLQNQAVQGSPVRVAIAKFNGVSFHVLAHRIDGVLILELEPQVLDQLSVAQLYSNLRASTLELQNARTLQQFLDNTVGKIKQFTGFDRIMIYKFLPDGSGEVLAESLIAGQTQYLGLHFPSSDIPAPAKRLFSLSWVRHQPDIGYTPVPLIPENNPITGMPLDMSYAILRSVSVMYTGYLKNMGTTSSMVMTLLKERQLWGLIACHHHTGPKHVPYEVRLACEFLSNMVSLLIAEKEGREYSDYKLKLRTTQNALIQTMSKTGEFFEALTQQSTTVLDFVRATGAAVIAEGKIVTLGETPSPGEIEELVKWIASRNNGPIFSTDSLPSLEPPKEKYKNTACGVLALRFAEKRSDSILWFRSEILQTVNWAGDPHKPVDVSDDGQRLLPRTSFALWKETVRLKCDPWLEVEIEAARELRIAILELITRKAEQLGELYTKLERSYVELDAFTYVASHDLKEPLRGIHNYARFLLEDCSQVLREEDIAKLKSILRLSERMENLLHTLLQYSRISRKNPDPQTTDTNAVLAETIESMEHRISAAGADIRVARPLPTIKCDPVSLSEIFSNLISNALKYNSKEKKWVEIGYLDQESAPTFYVRDNGIGIEAEHLKDVFTIFRRLHAPGEFGGGTGAGLTIARKLAERHGGSLWVESVPNEGSAFYFRLQPESGDEQ